MITAEEACQVAMDVESGKLHKEVNEIEDLVKAYMVDGKYEFHYPKRILPGTKTFLESNKYKVSSSNHPMDANTGVTISWEHLKPKPRR